MNEKPHKIVNGEKIELTEEEIFFIQQEQQEYEKEYLDNLYIQKRIREYPSLGEQLDMIFWDKVNNTNNWTNTIGSIKQKYPNPNNPVELNTDPKNQNNSSWKFW